MRTPETHGSKAGPAARNSASGGAESGAGPGARPPGLDATRGPPLPAPRSSQTSAAILLSRVSHFRDPFHPRRRPSANAQQDIGELKTAELGPASARWSSRLPKSRGAPHCQQPHGLGRDIGAQMPSGPAHNPNSQRRDRTARHSKAHGSHTSPRLNESRAGTREMASRPGGRRAKGLKT